MIPSPRAGLSLPYDPTAPRVARTFLEDRLAGSAADHEQREIARLLTSELVTNAVRYGLPPMFLKVEIGPDRVRVEVRDGSACLPVVADPPSGAEGGRGLLLLDRLAARWGAEPDRSGKTVWYELVLPVTGRDGGRSGA